MSLGFPRVLVAGFTLAALLSAHPCIAGELTTTPDGGSIWKAGIDGVEIEWNPDHTIKRVYSLTTQPVNFPDQRGVMKAQKIAEEKAKAAIIEFMHQTVTSSSVVTEINNDMQQSMVSQGGNSPAALSRSNQRTMTENLTQVTSSFASGSLNGVMVLERGYDSTAEMAWTKVGISQKSMAAALALHQATVAASNEQGAQVPGTDGPVNGQPTGPIGIPLARSQVQKTGQTDW
jgi:hypothetical protein